jgi:putative phosphoribosyl transferase
MVVKSSTIMLLFEDRKDAAEQLAKRLEEELSQRDVAIATTAQKEEQEQQKYDSNNIIILAIPRGGVVIGDIIASILNARLDIIVSRKIGAPDNPELAIGAVMPDGTYFLNEDIVNMLNVPQSYIVEQADIQKKEIQRRLMSFRGGSKEDSVAGDNAYDNNDNFEGKTVILVDDGIATGATILSAAQWLKTKQNCCKMLIVAVPVAPPDTIDKIKEVSDKVIVLYSPEIFGSVGRFYENFEQVSDDEVREIMKRHGYNT